MILPGRDLTLFLAALGAVMVMAALVLELDTPRLDIRIWSVFMALFLAVAALAAAIHRRNGRRLRLLLDSADALARGELRVRVPVDAHDELATMGRSLNAAAGLLGDKLVALRREGDASDAVISNLKQGVALLGRDLTIRRSNDRFWSIVGLARPASVARLSATRQPALEEIVEDAVRLRRPVTREISIYAEHRNEVEVSVVPILGTSGVNALLMSIEDLRPEREMAHLRREFVANVSHELKTPLTSIRGYAETLLQGGLEDVANRERFVATIRSQAERLESLVNDLLTLADLERPDATLDLKDWDLSSVVREVVSRFEELARRRGLHLSVEARSGIMARVDRHRIELALGNLLDNAAKYTDDGSVTVRVERTPDRIRVSVTDTGRGIAPEHLARIFERFYRADLGRAREVGGTGLGLSIVKHSVQLHGGVVGVESEQARGSTFWFEVPLEPPVRPVGDT